MSKNCRSGAKWEECVKLNTAIAAVSGQPVIVSHLIGTVVTAENASGDSVVNCAANAVYQHPVRNVRTYNQTGGEATWGAIAQGDDIYIDIVSLPFIAWLTTSPLNDQGGANHKFGKAQTADATAIAKTCTIDVQQIQE
jgi:hypothetical protein